MRYRIGEMAEFFGMTKEGVRYLERQKIISAVRDENNGYRYYPREEITRLKLIRSYQAIGFTIKEAQKMIQETPCAEIIARLDEKLLDMKKKEEQIRRMRKLLADQRAAADYMLNRDVPYEIMRRPAYVLFPRVEDEASGETPEEKERIARARRVEKEWIQNMPPVALGALHYDAQGVQLENLYGCVALLDVVHQQGLTLLPEMIHVPSCCCAHGMMESAVGIRPNMEDLFDWIIRQGMETCGEVFGVIQLTYRDAQGQLMRLHEIYVPVRKRL